MKYEKNEYSDLSVCGFIMGGIFLAWGINWMISSSTWFFIPGIVFLCIGIAILASQIRALRNRDKLRTIVKQEFEANPDATIEQVSETTGFSKKDVQAIVLDLKARGEFIGKFSSSTGKLKMATTQPAPSQPAPAQPSADVPKYCPSCGTPVKNKDAQFCQFCGAKI